MKDYGQQLGQGSERFHSMMMMQAIKAHESSDQQKKLNEIMSKINFLSPVEQLKDTFSPKKTLKPEKFATINPDL